MGGRPAGDAELVSRAREGDLEAFDQLIARHRARLLTIARRITGDGEAAQDVVQEGLVRAFRSLSSLRDGARFGPWLNTIVRRQGQRWLREGDREPEPADTASLRGAPTGIWGADGERTSGLAERIRAGLAELARRDRQVMVLHYLEGFTCEEIGAKLSLSTGSVKRILHNSRRRLRKGREAMGTGQEKSREPRRLVVWIDGNAGRERGNVFEHLRPLLAQAVCLAVNKEAKTARQISEEVGAHLDYVAETVEDLVEMEVLAVPQKGHYLANFIAFEAADWRRLMGMVREPAAKVAKELAAAEPRLRAAFEHTPLAASGWKWEEVIWHIYAIPLANAGCSRHQPAAYRGPRPQRPWGAYYWLGGHEEAPGFSPIWTTGFNTSGSLGLLNHGYFWTWGMRRERPAVVSSQPEQSGAIEALAEGPRTEAEVLERMAGDPDEQRGVLADLVKTGVVQRTEVGYRLTIPVFAQADSEALTPEIDAVMGPIVAEITEPALAGVDSLLDEMGYSHRREQYLEWHRWLTGDIMGEALRFLMEQGVLPRPPDPAPANFAWIAWMGRLPLMAWRADY